MKNASQFLSCNQTIARLPFRWNTFFVDQSFVVVRIPQLTRFGFQCRPPSKQHFFSIAALKNAFEIIYVRTEIRTWDS